MLKFGIFDHLDSDGQDLGPMLETRLGLIELIENEGYAGYHMAEHHATPLGMASSPNVFLTAAFHRTRHMRMGPLVYVLPLYHPLRLYEEICMLDHMSGGRLMIGVGRGGALIEHQRYGVDPADAPAMYREAFDVLMRAFASDVLNFEGKFFRYKDFVVQAKPVQRPHPPIWYGAPNADAIAWAAARGVNVVSLGPAARARAIADRYHQEWTALEREPTALPHIGVTRHLVVAESDAAARAHRDRRLFTLAELHGLAFPALERDLHTKGYLSRNFRRPGKHRSRRCRFARHSSRLSGPLAERNARKLRAVPDGIRRHEFR